MHIVDKKIKPYSVKMTGGNYDVLEKTKKKDSKGERIYKTHGHFSSTESALNKISKLIVETDRKITIKKYIKEIKETRIKITR